MEERIAIALKRLFESERIVFWFDAEQEFSDVFQQLELPGVEKICPLGYELGVKYRVLHQSPKKKFLLYLGAPPPPDEQNWLLDLQLASGEFQADQVSLMVSELGLDPHLSSVVEEHVSFFKAKGRRDTLRKLLETNESPDSLRTKMCAVCTNASPRLESILEKLLEGFSPGEDPEAGEGMEELRKFGLDRFFWHRMQTSFGYASSPPRLLDFLVLLFRQGLVGEDAPSLSRDALVFLDSWKKDRTRENSFRGFAGKFEKLLNVEKRLENSDYREWLPCDTFHAIDRHILFSLCQGLSKRTLPLGEVSRVVQARGGTHWFSLFSHFYLFLENVAAFFRQMDELDLHVESLADGVGKYVSSWYRVDQLARRVVFHFHQAKRHEMLEGLFEEVQRRYVNDFLRKLGEKWQVHVEKATRWEAGDVPLQRHFFFRWVRPFLDEKHKVCVIVSDGLRYELAQQLCERIGQMDRHESNLEHALGVLPSYTQLGMAALLPGKQLAIHSDAMASVWVDGQNSAGTENRRKILDCVPNVRATALQAEVFLSLKSDECRALVRDHDVLYIFQNRIDAEGDNRNTEGEVFEAAEKAIKELEQLVKKCTSANANNVLVTADHGFLYQDSPLQQGDFVGDASFSAGQSEGIYRDRRFVIGERLASQAGLVDFCPEKLGIAPGIQVQIPRSTLRLRLSGSGSRYVHGGATLQEVVVPVLKVNKKRQSDRSQVDVEILKGTESSITSGQLSVRFYQAQPVSAKVGPRTLRIALYTSRGVLISNQQQKCFDSHSESARDRETVMQFLLTREADTVNGETVELRLEEPLGGTTHYREYRTEKYLLRRSFSSDFDF